MQYTYSISVDSLQPILDDILSDYSGKRQSFALSIRFSVAQVGMVVAILVVSALYGIRKSLVDPFVFMLGFVVFGLIIGFAVIYVDSKGSSTVCICDVYSLESTTRSNMQELERNPFFPCADNDSILISYWG